MFKGRAEKPNGGWSLEIVLVLVLVHVLEKRNGSRTRPSTRAEDDTENEISRDRKAQCL